MSSTEAQKEMVGQLLDTMKYVSEKSNSLSEAGITVSSLAEIESMIWDAIKTAAGMPAEEKLGVWISDLWFDKAADYCCGETSRDKAVGSILNWDKG